MNERRGTTLIDVVGCVVAIVGCACILVPSLGAASGDDEAISADNLRQIGMMHVSYAADFNGRQWTVTPDDFSKRIGSYRTSYGDDIAPPVPLGFDCDGVFHQTSLGIFIQQGWWPNNCSLGNFRAWNTQPFNQYANNKVFDPLFWAPRDPMPQDNPEIMKYWDLPCEWPGAGTRFWYPTYCMSLAAQVDPGVYRGEQDGGAQRALSLPFGHQTPNLSQARFPDLKTHMLEHYWLNPPPKDPYIPGTGGVPWFFNMSNRSQPISLMFDGSVRKVSVLESLVSNDQVVRQGADALWAEDAACFGRGGYFVSYSRNEPLLGEILIDTFTSYHVHTRDGILGRDTIFSE